MSLSGSLSMLTLLGTAGTMVIGSESLKGDLVWKKFLPKRSGCRSEKRLQAESGVSNDLDVEIFTFDKMHCSGLEI